MGMTWEGNAKPPGFPPEPVPAQAGTGMAKRMPAETAAERGEVRARRQGSAAWRRDAGGGSPAMSRDGTAGPAASRADQVRCVAAAMAARVAKGDAEGGSRSRRGNRRVPRPTKQDKAWHLALAAGSRRLVEPWSKTRRGLRNCGGRP